MSKFSAIPQPDGSLSSLHTAIIALKESVEVLARQRGNVENSAVTWSDLLKLNNKETGKQLIDPAQVPKTKGT